MRSSSCSYTDRQDSRHLGKYLESSVYAYWILLDIMSWHVMARNIQMPALIGNQNYRNKKGWWVFSDMGDPTTTPSPNKARATNITANSPKKAPFFNWVRTTFAEKYVAACPKGHRRVNPGASKWDSGDLVVLYIWRRREQNLHHHSRSSKAT